jgi:hypothetical protein
MTPFPPIDARGMNAPLSRRAMLEQTATGFGMLGLLGMFGHKAHADITSTPALKHALIKPKAKRVIFLFMNGGPSHIDTFDPKPALASHEGSQPDGDLYKKPKTSGFMPSPFKFSRHGQSGIQVSESLPKLAEVIDECCILRSMHTDVPNHEPALLQMHTGNIQPVRPAFGSWLLYGLGTENQNLPGYVVLRPSPNIVVGPALWSNSFLPAKYQATSILTSDLKIDQLIRHIRNPRYSLKEQREQLDLVQALNQKHLASRAGDSELDAQIKSMETAYRMQMQAFETLDVEKETTATREMYGGSTFAQSCLMARRLVESGVRCVTVYYTNKGNQPWDTHTNHNEGHTRLCADSDRATAALIKDLKQRGLLEDTLVIWGGEFGRTPYSETRDDDKKPAGRDHHHTAFSMLLAGGGVKGGMTYGNSDELGMVATENPMHVHDLHATLLYLMGLDHEQLTYRYSGRDFRLTDVSGSVCHDIIA